MKTLVLIFIVGIAVLLLIGMTGVFLLWGRGAGTLLLPGLGILITMPRLLVILGAVETILIVSAVLIWRS